MRIKVEEAADVMGTTKLTVQTMMKKGIIKIGDVVPNKKRTTYIIHSGLLAQHLGISEIKLIIEVKKYRDLRKIS